MAGEKRRASSSRKGACRWRRRAAESRRRGAGRGDFDLDEAELVAGRRNAGRRELVEEEEAGGLKVVATLQPPGIRIGGGPAALGERSQLSTGRAEPVTRDDGWCCGGRGCLMPAKRVEGRDRSRVVAMLIESERL